MSGMFYTWKLILNTLSYYRDYEQWVYIPFWIQNKILLWIMVEQKIQYYLPAVLNYQLFRAGTLSYYTSVKVQSLTDGRHLMNVFFF